MNRTRSTCITITLLLVAVSLAYGGFCIVRGTQTEAERTSGGLDPISPANPAVLTSGTVTSVGSSVSTANASISAIEAQALDAQLRVIERELESLQMPEDPGDAAIGEGLD